MIHIFKDPKIRGQYILRTETLRFVDPKIHDQNIPHAKNLRFKGSSAPNILYTETLRFIDSKIRAQITLYYGNYVIRVSWDVWTAFDMLRHLPALEAA